MQFLRIIFLVISLILVVYTAYIVIIAFFGLKKPRRFVKSTIKKRFCIAIAAKNEEKVIANLINSLNEQNYPKDKLDIYVLLNNCTDNTKKIALSLNAKIVDYANDVKDKGAALKAFFSTSILDKYDAFCIFDADNLVDKNYISEMNDALCSGINLAQGYRDSKNPKDSWLSSCYSIYFWIINRLVNFSHNNLGLNAYLNGTGIMVSSSVLKQVPFKTETFTEDLEYTILNILDNQTVTYVGSAVFYDEHTNSFKASVIQRKRWSTGMIQCFKKYSLELIKKAFKEKKFIYFDVFLYTLTSFIQLLVFISALLYVIIVFLSVKLISAVFLLLFTALGGFILSLALSFFVLLTDHKKLSDIHPQTFFLFWLFILSFNLINVVCFFAPTKKWIPVKHVKNISISDMTRQND